MAMKTIEVSDAVWGAIVSREKSGETPDDVLRRMFKIPSDRSHVSKRRSSGGKRLATRPMRDPRIENGQLVVEFEDGPNRWWTLPDRNDKISVKKVTHEAMAFARDNGATEGQENAVRKALTDNGYHITK